jgi:hypothetical protein
MPKHKSRLQFFSHLPVILNTLTLRLLALTLTLTRRNLDRNACKQCSRWGEELKVDAWVNEANLDKEVGEKDDEKSKKDCEEHGL